VLPFPDIQICDDCAVPFGLKRAALGNRDSAHREHALRFLAVSFVFAVSPAALMLCGNHKRDAHSIASGGPGIRPPPARTNDGVSFTSDSISVRMSISVQLYTHPLIRPLFEGGVAVPTYKAQRRDLLVGRARLRATLCRYRFQRRF
jgi:hypothetical protein